MKIAFVLLVLLLSHSATAACLRPQPRLVCAEYFSSQVVVQARLLREKALHSKDDPEGIAASVYTLEATRDFRGHIGRTFRVYESNDSGRATFEWKTGQSYLLFLEFSKRDDGWVLDGCGNSGPLSDSKATLADIRALTERHGSTGMIRGVVSTKALDDVLPGISVEAIGRASTYGSKTDANGEFRMTVPAGVYRVRAIQPGTSFGTADLSYGNSQHLNVPRGGCVQLQLAER